MQSLKIFIFLGFVLLGKYCCVSNSQEESTGFGAKTMQRETLLPEVHKHKTIVPPCHLVKREHWKLKGINDEDDKFSQLRRCKKNVAVVFIKPKSFFATFACIQERIITHCFPKHLYFTWHLCYGIFNQQFILFQVFRI